MSIAKLAASCGVTEVLHFTTSHGCLGTLYTKMLQSRHRLADDEMVEFLFAPNAKLRKDRDFVDYVSLSISHINAEFYRVSSGSWHRSEPIFWCILSFSIDILDHPGVVFATTNNIYTGVMRGSGEVGFERLFAPCITRWAGNVVRRDPNLSALHPTCAQAEALYPIGVPTDYLQRIYVRTATDQAETIGFLKATFHPDVAVEVAPEKFGERPL